MGLNKRFVKMKKDRRAEMGVGTMIIFIAMVLVAAVAASVLIGTANQVREQAQSTGTQAINNVATGFIVHDTVGIVAADKKGVDEITVYLRLAAGSPRINMANVMVTLISGDVNQVMSMYAGDAIAAWVNTPEAYINSSAGAASPSDVFEMSKGHLVAWESPGSLVPVYYMDASGAYRYVPVSDVAEIASIAVDGSNHVSVTTTGGATYELYVGGDVQSSIVETTYFADPIQRTDSTIPWDTANYVVAQGDLIVLHIVVEDGKEIGFSQAGVIKIMTAYGQMNQIEFMTPESFSTSFVTL